MSNMVIVEHYVIFVFACCGEYGTSTMPSISFIRCHHTVAGYVSFAQSFDFFCSRFSIFANCSCCCYVLLFRLCFSCFTFCLRCGVICGGGLLSLFSQWSVSLYFFEFRLHGFNVFSAWSRTSYSVVSCFLYS